MLATGASLFAIDFAACGHSEGEYISLGWYERDDVQTVIDYLRRENNAHPTSTIALWGRSMGAVSAVFQAALSLLQRLRAGTQARALTWAGVRG